MTNHCPTNDRTNDKPAEWPADLLEHIEKDKQRRIITRGVTMNDQLIEPNAEVLLKTMREFRDEILPALRQHPLSDELAQHSIEAKSLEIAKALLLIVEDNPTLRQEFLEGEVANVRLDEKQDKESRESRLNQTQIMHLGNKVADIGHYLDLYLQQQDQSLSRTSNQSRLSGFVAGFLSS